MFKLAAIISAIATAFLFSLSNFHYLSLAVPLDVAERDAKIVFNPHITYPDGAAIWPMGSIQNVTWDTVDLPNEKRKATGIVLLGYLENGSEHLDIKNPLAIGFRMDAGYVPVKVPTKLRERSDYICVVFGDSGNISQQFKIVRSH